MADMSELQALIEEQRKKSVWPGALGQAGASVLTGQRMGPAQAIATFLQGLAGGMQSGKEGQQTQLQALLKQKMDMEYRQMQMDEMRAKIAQAGQQSPKDLLDLMKTQKEFEKMGRDAEAQKNNSLAEQNLGVFQDPSQFEGMAPEDQERAKSSVRSAMLSQDPKVWNDFSRENTRVEELNRKDQRDAANEEYRNKQYDLSERRTATAERRADTAERRATETGGKSESRFAMSLRKEFNALQPVKDYRDISSKYSIMNKALEESQKTNNFVAVDQAIITLYNKMTDPQSVVRESEYVRTPQDMAWMNRAKAAMQRVSKGGRLDPNSRQAIMTMATKFKEAYDGQYNALADEWSGYAAGGGVDPKMVIGTRPAAQAAKENTQSAAGKKTVVKQFKSPSTGKTKIVYSDGSEEIR